MSMTLKTLVAAAALAATALASATPIVGSAQLTFGRVLVTPGNIDFNGPINTPPNPTATFGTFATSPDANTGIFNTLPGVTFGNQVHDLSQVPGDANYMPIGSFPAGLADMFVFEGRTSAPADSTHWMFTATGLAAGTTINGNVTPYVLTEQTINGQFGTGAQITLSGWACDDTKKDGICQVEEDKSTWVATISAQYPGLTINDLVNRLTADPFALPNNTWSGTLTASALPEPASLALVGLALAGLGFAGRRKSK